MDPTIPMKASVTSAITEWFGLSMGVMAFISPITAVTITIPIR